MSTREQGGVGSQPPAKRKSRGSHILSTLLFLTAIGFAAVAGYLYWEEQQQDQNDPTPPAAEPGRWELAQVRSAFDQAGFETEVGRTNGHTDQMEGVPGQALTLDGTEIYIFIFSPSIDSHDPVAMAEAAYSGIDESTLFLQRQSSGAIISEGEPLSVFHGSNIVAIMVGGDDDDIERARSTIEGLT